MRQVQVTIPEDFIDETREILEDYSSDISSSEVEKDGYKAVEITSTVRSEDIDKLAKSL